MYISNIFYTRCMSSIVTSNKLNLFYDVASPYAWFAFEVIVRYKKYWNIDLHLEPVLLGGIFKNSNNVSPLAASPAKALHISDDVKRCATYFDVPLVPMKDISQLFIKGSVLPMRFLTAVNMFSPDKLEPASRAFWMIRWNQDKDFTTSEALEEVGATSAISPQDMKIFIHEAESNEVKTALRKNTEFAVDCGVFGVPSFSIEKDGSPIIIFGSDRFPILAQELGEEWKGPQPY